MKQAKYIGMAVHQATISVAAMDGMLGCNPTGYAQDPVVPPR